jgi:hypothetical protein
MSFDKLLQEVFVHLPHQQQQLLSFHQLYNDWLKSMSDELVAKTQEALQTENYELLNRLVDMTARLDEAKQNQIFTLPPVSTTNSAQLEKTVLPPVPKTEEIKPQLSELFLTSVIPFDSIQGCRFGFDGQKHEAKNCTDLLVVVCKSLLERNREEFMKLVRNPLDKRFNNKSDGSLGEKILGKDIYLNVILSNDDTIALIKKLMSDFKVDVTEFRIYVSQ